jgi:tRNA (guanine37-N1)-methyltransferase
MLALDVITLFPEMFRAVTDYGVTRRAFEQSEFEQSAVEQSDASLVNLKLWQPIADAIVAARARQSALGFDSHVIYFSPHGAVLAEPWVAGFVASLTEMKPQRKRALILLCGRYEGVDQRLLEREVDEFMSIGDFVLSGGEMPAMVLIDALVRRLPGVLNDSESAVQESFHANTGLLDWPHYTRPEVWNDQPIPDVLKGGNHAEIAKWRLAQAKITTKTRRPDLWEAALKQGLADESSPKKAKVPRKTPEK